MRWFIAIILLALWPALPTQAHVTCGDRTAMVKQLSEYYGETRKGAGLANSTTLFEIWTSDVTGSWTILKTHPSGVACTVATGKYWVDDLEIFTQNGRRL